VGEEVSVFKRHDKVTVGIGGLRFVGEVEVDSGQYVKGVGETVHVVLNGDDYSHAFFAGAVTLIESTEKTARDIVARKIADAHDCEDDHPNSCTAAVSITAAIDLQDYYAESIYRALAGLDKEDEDE
jgi:hypothetical protein